MREHRLMGRLRLLPPLLSPRCYLRGHAERLAVRLVLAAAAVVVEVQHLLQSQAAEVVGVVARSLAEEDGRELSISGTLSK